MRDRGRNWLCGIVEKYSFHLYGTAAAEEEEEDTLFHLTNNVTEEEDGVRGRISEPRSLRDPQGCDFILCRVWSNNFVVNCIPTTCIF